MTRLKTDDIGHIAGDLQAYDRRLRSNLGISLANLACRAAGLPLADRSDHLRGLRVTAVPMTCGQGVIDTFSQTLCGIARLLGFTAAVTELNDVAGLARAFESESDIILVADDARFIAFNTRTRKVVDNGEATGSGFATGLAYMAGSVEDRPVLVLGCGPVGKSCARKVAELGGRVTIYDIVPERCRRFAADNHDLDITIADSLSSALAGHDLILEATPAADIIGAEMILDSTLVAAPGVPCGVSAKGREFLGGRLLWDPLQIGVATMLMEAVQDQWA